MSAYPEAPEAAAAFDKLRDPHPVNSGWARVAEEEGVPVACARGAYFTERWAAIVCRSVEPPEVRAALRRCLLEPDLPDAVCSVFDLSPLASIRRLLLPILLPGGSS